MLLPHWMQLECLFKTIKVGCVLTRLASDFGGDAAIFATSHFSSCSHVRSYSGQGGAIYGPVGSTINIVQSSFLGCRAGYSLTLLG